MSQLGWQGLAAAQMFVVGLDLYIVAPLLPYMARAARVGVTHAGLLVTSFAIVYAIFSPWLGRISDQVGHRPVGMAGLALFAVADLALGLSASFWSLMAWRAVAGLGAAAFTPSLYAVLSELPTARSATKRTALMAAATLGLSLATILGVPVGSLLAAYWSWRFIFVALAILAALSGIGVMMTWPSVQGQGTPEGSRIPELGPWPPVVLTLLLFTSVGVLYTYLPLFLHQVLFWSWAWAGAGLWAWGVGNLLGIMLTPRFEHASGRLWSIVGGFGIALGGVLLLFAPGALAKLLGLSWLGMGSGVSPLLKSWASIGPRRAAHLAWNNSAIYAGLTVGSLIGSRLMTISHALWLAAAAIFLLAGGLTELHIEFSRWGQKPS